MIMLLIFATAISVCIAVAAYRRAGELPDSVSSFAYYVGALPFSLWCVTMVLLLYVPIVQAMLPYGDVGSAAGVLTLSGIMLVSASPYYRTENKVLHYAGGYLFGIASQVVVALLCPWLLLGWIIFCVFVLVTTFLHHFRSWKENATIVSEGICFLTLIVSLTV